MQSRNERNSHSIEWLLVKIVVGNCSHEWTDFYNVREGAGNLIPIPNLGFIQFE